MHNTSKSHIYQEFFVFVESKSLSARSKTEYLRRVRLLARHYPKRSLKKITERQVFDYLLYLRDDQKRRPGTLQQALAALRMFYRDFLNYDWELLRNFTIRRSSRLPVVLSQQETHRFLAAVRENRFKVIFALIYHCGLRVNEALSLRPSDIDGSRGVVRILHGKGGKAREVPICSHMLERLRRYWRFHRNPQWLFPSIGHGWKGRGLSLAEAMREGERPLSVSSIQVTLQRARADSGIKKHFTCHSLRHSFATHLLEGGVSISQVSEYLGHSGLDSTLIYLHVTEISEHKGRGVQETLFEKIVGK